MTISLANPVQSTWIFIAILVLALACTVRFRTSRGLSHDASSELKGFAILAVVFSHIGYFLVNQHEFLFPLSVLAGVGVNLFLFLSGYGLTLSQLEKGERVSQFYRRKLTGLFVPFWIVLALFLVMDKVILGITYSTNYMLKSFAGLFTTANIFTDINSPLWYFTIILFYYLLFPLLFMRKAPWLSAILMFYCGYLVVREEPKVLENVIGLYETHLYAFPLGMLVASWAGSQNLLWKKFKGKMRDAYRPLEGILSYLISALLCGIIAHFAIHSGVGEKVRVEQTISLITMFAILALFAIKRIRIGLLGLFGVYSYEIYLLHWPLMYRYDVLYANLPAGLATTVWMAFLLLLGWLLKRGATNAKNLLL